MKKPLILPSLLVLALVGCKSSSKPSVAIVQQPAAQNPNVGPTTPAPPPKYGWKEFHAETFELHPIQSKAFRLPSMTAKLRVKVDATSGILGGVITEASLDNAIHDHKILRTGNFEGKPCSLLLVDKSEVKCNLDSKLKSVYFVRDVRAEGTLMGVAIGAKVGSRKLVERAALPNKIQISLSRWGCLENCSKLEAEVGAMYGIKN